MADQFTNRLHKRDCAVETKLTGSKKSLVPLYS